MIAARSLVLPAFVAACLIFGGSGQGIWSNLLLQWTGLALLAVTLARGGASWPATSKLLQAVILLGFAWALVQLVPLPPALWTLVPGREIVAQGYAITSEPLPWRPLSLDPSATIASLLATIPALATLVVTVRTTAVSKVPAAAAVLVAAAAGILLGIIQLGGGNDYYLYPISNVGAAAGFFANSNHMAALLLIAIPFFAALLAKTGTAAGRTRSVTWWIAAVVGVALLGVGIVTNGSFAIILLGAPVVAASVLLVVPPGAIRVGRMIVLTGILAAVGLVILLVTATSGLSAGNLSSVAIRSDIWSRTLSLLATFGLGGTGLGTFPAVYPLAESPASVDWVYINHAHNDFLEIALELGLPGVLLVVVFLWWWVRRTVALWRMREPLQLARAATIASGALLLHSLVDYPLRTAALSSVFGLSIGLMVVGARRPAGPDRSTTGARHLTIEDLG